MLYDYVYEKTAVFVCILWSMLWGEWFSGLALTAMVGYRFALGSAFFLSCCLFLFIPIFALTKPRLYVFNSVGQLSYVRMVLGIDFLFCNGLFLRYP